MQKQLQKERILLEEIEALDFVVDRLSLSDFEDNEVVFWRLMSLLNKLKRCCYENNKKHSERLYSCNNQ